MAPMKTMKSKKVMKSVKAMTKTDMAKAIDEELEMKPAECSKVLESLAAIATTEVKKTGKFVIPGVAMIKTRVKPATKAGKRIMFGVETKVKAKPARTVVKAFAVAALKHAI